MEGDTGPGAEAFSSPICSIAATCLTLLPVKVRVEQAGAHPAHSRSLVDEGPRVLCTQGLKRKKKKIKYKTYARTVGSKVFQRLGGSPSF